MSVLTVKAVKKRRTSPCFSRKVVCIHVRIAALLHDVGIYCSGGLLWGSVTKAIKMEWLEELATPLYGGICAMQINVVWTTMDNYGNGRSGPLRRGCGTS